MCKDFSQIITHNRQIQFILMANLVTFVLELVIFNTPVMTIYTACHLCVYNICCSLNQPYTHTYTQAQCNHWQWNGRAAFFLPCWASLSSVAEKSLRSLFSMFVWPDRNPLIRKKRYSTLTSPKKGCEKTHPACQIKQKQHKQTHYRQSAAHIWA